MEDEEALLEKREVVTFGHPEEDDTIWVEKWVGGVGNYNVRTFVAFALMGKAGELEDLVEDTCFIGISTVDPSC